MSWNGEERREYKRFGVKRLGIQYSRGGLPSFLGGYSDKYLVLNLSEGGMFFMTKEDLQPGTRISFRLEPSEGAPVKGKADVVWGAKSVDHDAWKIGCEFVKMGEGQLRKLRGIIDSSVLDHIDVSTSIYLREVERL